VRVIIASSGGPRLESQPGVWFNTT